MELEGEWEGYSRHCGFVGSLVAGGRRPSCLWAIEGLRESENGELGAGRRIADLDLHFTAARVLGTERRRRDCGFEGSKVENLQTR